MADGHDTDWTIAELGEAVRRALAVDYDAPSNGQIRGVPDRRTIRFYSTLGLLDRPSGARGRTALYGRRHLAQLVAIKRLQAAGRSLGDIQTELAGLDDAALEAIARLPEAGLSAAPPPPAARPKRRRADFWAEAPADGAEAAPTVAAPSPAPVMAGVPVDARLTLLLAPTRPVRAEDVDAIRAAAAPLLAALEELGLIEPVASVDEGDDR